jgi:3-hydroxybutyryl-CoA dehydrogenase
MQLGDIRDVGVVGAGTMGAGIAQVFAQAGYTVRWYNRSAAGLRRGLARIRDNQSLLIRHGALTAGQAEAALARLHPTEELTDLAGVQLVSESIAENLSAKQALFKALDRRCGDAAIFTTNTSGLSISRLAEAVSRPQRFAGLHYANPAHIIPAIEIIKGEETSDATCEVLTALARRLGKRPVLVQREVPGFIANRLQFALLREALHLIEAGVASAADVDATIRHGLGLRWALFGPLEIADLGGLDVFDTIAGYLFQDLSNTAEVPSILHQRVAEGRLGIKSGDGFYTYTPEQGQALAAQRDEALLALLHVKQRTGDDAT